MRPEDVGVPRDPGLRPLDPLEGRALSARRDGIMRRILEAGALLARDNPSKPYTRALSPGCESCVRGKWSCLFVNYLCTRDCPFCAQDRSGTRELPPRAEGLTFAEPAEYVAYLERFGYDGVSFSGGEPLLAFDRVLAFLGAIRRRFGDRHHIWLYTNGDLVTDDRLRALSDAGLNEIRFDLAARDYDLAPVRLAVGRIETVSIEIPALPEDAEIVRRAMPAWAEIGVRFLNLHQLYLIGNWDALRLRPYTWYPLAWTGTEIEAAESGHIFPVIESEMLGLELLLHAQEMGLPLAVNYCAALYKQRFQSAGRFHARARQARADFESITEMGLLRRLSLLGPPERLGGILEGLDAGVARRCLLRETEEGGRELVFPEDIWPRLRGAMDGLSLNVVYEYPVQDAAGESGGVPIRFSGRTVRVGRSLAGEVEFDDREMLHAFASAFLGGGNPDLLFAPSPERETVAVRGVGAHDATAREQLIEVFSELEFIPRALPDYHEMPTRPFLQPPPDLGSPPEDAIRSPTGLIQKILRKGAGEGRAGPDDTVRVHYSGWNSDGSLIDTTKGAGHPVELKLGETIAGWREAVAEMAEGERRRLWIPGHLAYADATGRPRGDLVFEVELVKIIGAEAAGRPARSRRRARTARPPAPGARDRIPGRD